MSDRGRAVVPFPRAAPAPILNPIRLRYPSDINGPPPPPRWTVDAMLLPGTVCLLSGASNVGKSLAAHQLLSAIALGVPWMGRATEQARCLAVFCEDRPDELDRRSLQICEHYDVHTSLLEHEFAWDAREDRDAVLWDVEFGKGRPTDYWLQLFGERAGQGLVGQDGYRVVLLDTAAAVFQGNHNDPRQVNLFMRALTRAAVMHDCTILLNAHPSRSSPRTFGGSAQWEAACRFAFNLARPEPTQGLTEEDMRYGDAGYQRIFRGLGSNYVATPRPEKWRWRDGVFILDDMAVDARPPHDKIGDQERRDIQYRLLMGLKRAMQNGAQVPADEMASRSLANLARRCVDPEINRVPFNELYAAQQALLDAGQIVRVRVGSRCLVRPQDMVYPNEEAWLL